MWAPIVAAVAGPLVMELFKNNNNNNVDNNDYYRRRNRDLMAVAAMQREELHWEQQRNSELRDRLRAREAETERYKTWIGVAVVSFVSCYLALQLFSGRNAHEAKLPAYPPYEPSFEESRYDSISFHKSRNYDNEHFSNDEEVRSETFEHTSDTQNQNEASFTEYKHASNEGGNQPKTHGSAQTAKNPTPEPRRSGGLARLFYAVVDLVCSIFNLIVAIVPGFVLVFASCLFHDYCSENKINFWSCCRNAAASFIAIFGFIFGFLNLLSMLFNIFMPGIVVIIICSIFIAIIDKS